MISSTEIREGNWVHHSPIWSYRNPDLKDIDFKWTDTDWYALGECTLNLEDLSPISLSETWLLRFKFNTDQITWWKGDFIIGNYRDGFWLLPTGRIDERGTEIKYIHQLQNLYFLLTGEEIDL